MHITTSYLRRVKVEARIHALAMWEVLGEALALGKKGPNTAVPTMPLDAFLLTYGKKG